MIKKILTILIILAILSTYCFNTVYATSVDDDYILSVLKKQVDTNYSYLVLHAVGLYTAQSSLWTEFKTEILERLTGPDCGTLTYLQRSDNTLIFDIYYGLSSSTGSSMTTEIIYPDGNTSYNIQCQRLRGIKSLRYTFNFSSNAGTFTYYTNQSHSFPQLLTNTQNNNTFYVPDFFINFIEWINTSQSSGGTGGGSIDYNTLKSIIIEALEEAGSDTTTINNIASSVDNISTATQNIASSSTATQQAAEATQQTAEAIENFIKDTTVNDSSYNQTNVNVPDSSASDLDGIFNQLKNIFISGQAVDIVIPIPFTNGGNITIPSSLTRDMLGTSTPAQTIINLIELIYNFLLARWIVKDVTNYISKLKDGSIVEGSTTDIKADML